MGEVINLAAFRRAKNSSKSAEKKDVKGSEYALKPGAFADSFEEIQKKNAEKKKRQDAERLKESQRKSKITKDGGYLP